MEGGEAQRDSDLTAEQAVASFIARWSGVSGSERANYQLFLTELCTLLALPQPDPASDATADNAYVFERRVHIHRPDGSQTHGFIDLYRRGCFVLEAKQSGKALDSSGWGREVPFNSAKQSYLPTTSAMVRPTQRPPFLGFELNHGCARPATGHEPPC